MVSFFPWSSSSKPSATSDDTKISASPAVTSSQAPAHQVPPAATKSDTVAPKTQEVSPISPISTALEDSALNVVARTAAFTAVGAIFGSTFGIIRAEANIPPIVLATKGAKSMFLYAGPFYAVREYLLNPLLVTYLPTQAEQQASPGFKNLATSPVAGGVVGYFTAHFSGRGPQAGRAAAFFAALSLSCQVIGNGVHVLVLNRKAKNEVHVEHSGGKANTREASPSGGTPPSSESDPPLPKPDSAEPSTGFFGKLFSSITFVRKLPDEEYIQILEDRKRQLEEDLKALDQES